MLNMTEQLKKWLQDECEIKEDATDEELQKAAGDALANGKLSIEKFAELTKDPDADKANDLGSKLDALTDGLAKMVETIQPKQDETKEKEAETKETETKETETKETKAETTEDQKKRITELSEKIARLGGTEQSQDGPQPRVKGAHEGYSTTKSAMTYPDQTKSGRPHSLAGRQVTDFGRPLDTASDLDRACAGVWAKYQIYTVTQKLAGNAHLAYEKLTEHERGLFDHMRNEMEWDFSEDGKLAQRKLTAAEKQAPLMDDAVSGGIEAAPVVFDDQVISTPLLYGELYPLVNTVVLSRGRRIEGVAIDHVTGGWGGVDDALVELFDSTAYVTGFDTTIWRWEGAIRIGLDFVSDTPINFGAIITAQYGERLLQDLDNAVATGDGTDEPLGVLNTAGITTVGWGGATSIGNYESLFFSIHKREFLPNVAASAVFCGTFTTYGRMKAIPVGDADSRRLFGTNPFGTGGYHNYTMMDHAYKINESLTEEQVFFAILARYRMYRRKGLAIRTSTEGDTLIRRNELLIVAMARYGGQMERAACCARTMDAPA